jgi:hypothetical protein
MYPAQATEVAKSTKQDETFHRVAFVPRSTEEEKPQQESRLRQVGLWALGDPREIRLVCYTVLPRHQRDATMQVVALEGQLRQLRM